MRPKGAGSFELGIDIEKTCFCGNKKYSSLSNQSTAVWPISSGSDFCKATLSYLALKHWKEKSVLEMLHYLNGAIHLKAEGHQHSNTLKCTMTHLGLVDSYLLITLLKHLSKWHLFRKHELNENSF